MDEVRGIKPTGTPLSSLCCYSSAKRRASQVRTHYACPLYPGRRGVINGRVKPKKHSERIHNHPGNETDGSDTITETVLNGRWFFHLIRHVFAVLYIMRLNVVFTCLLCCLFENIEEGLPRGPYLRLRRSEIRTGLRNLRVKLIAIVISRVISMFNTCALFSQKRERRMGGLKLESFC